MFKVAGDFGESTHLHTEYEIQHTVTVSVLDNDCPNSANIFVLLFGEFKKIN